MHRLFVGLRPPRAMRERLLAAMGGVAGARWQIDEQLHLSLRFLGDVPRPLAKEVALVLGQIRFPPLELALSGVGQFADSRGRVNTLWAGVSPHHSVTRLHRKVDQAVQQMGIAADTRAFLPHITLARLNVPMAATERFLADQAGLHSSSALFDHLYLWESRLGGERAVYETVARYPLTG